MAPSSPDGLAPLWRLGELANACSYGDASHGFLSPHADLRSAPMVSRESRNSLPSDPGTRRMSGWESYDGTHRNDFRMSLKSIWRLSGSVGEGSNPQRSEKYAPPHQRRAQQDPHTDHLRRAQRTTHGVLKQPQADPAPLHDGSDLGSSRSPLVACRALRTGMPSLGRSRRATHVWPRALSSMKSWITPSYCTVATGASVGPGEKFRRQLEAPKTGSERWRVQARGPRRSVWARSAITNCA